MMDENTHYCAGRFCFAVCGAKCRGYAVISLSAVVPERCATLYHNSTLGIAAHQLAQVLLLGGAMRSPS
jgi:hypothetical protein